MPANKQTSIWTRAFVLVFVASMFQEMSFGLLIHLPGYFSDLGGSEGQIGLVFAAAAVVALLLRPYVGKLLDLKGRQRVLRVVALADALFILAYLAVGSFGLSTYLVRILQGTTEILMFTGHLAYAADALPSNRRTEGMAYFGLSGLVPIALSPLLGDYLLRSGSFTALFVTASGLGFIGWLVILRMPVLRIGHAGSRPRRGFRAAVMQREIIPIWVIVFTFAAALTVVFTFMATFVEETGIGSLGLFFVVYGLSAAAVRIVAADLPGRLGTRKVLIPTFSGLIVMFVLLASATSTAGFVVAALVGGIGHGLVFPILSASAVDRTRSAERGSALAFFTALFDMSTLSVAPIIGTVIDRAGYPAAFRSIAVLMVIGLSLYWVLDRRVTPAGPA